MSVNTEKYVHDYANRMAPFSHRQMPVFSQVGKGLKGNDFEIEVNEDGTSSELIGKYHNQITDETIESWRIRLTDLSPKLHYETWKGVREIDGVNWWVYYNRFTCNQTLNGDTITYWTFDTPFAIMYPFNGAAIPRDTKIDSDKE